MSKPVLLTSPVTIGTAALPMEVVVNDLEEADRNLTAVKMLALPLLR